MPVIVVGADTLVGRAIVEALAPNVADLRAFVTDPESVSSLRAMRVKVAVGDISDGSHVGSAAMGVHTMILVGEAATDDRERSFAAAGNETLSVWRDAAAGSRRTIWVTDSELTEDGGVLVRPGGRSPEQIAQEISVLEAAE